MKQRTREVIHSFIGPTYSRLHLSPESIVKKNWAGNKRSRKSMGRDVGLSLGQHYTQRTDTVTNLIESPNLSGYLEQSKLLTDVSILFLLWDLVNLYDKQIFYPTEKDRERERKKKISHSFPTAIRKGNQLTRSRDLHQPDAIDRGKNKI